MDLGFVAVIETWTERRNKLGFVRLTQSKAVPILISPLPVVKSVGTPFRALSGGVRVTPTYRPVLLPHICMPAVACCQRACLATEPIASGKRTI